MGKFHPYITWVVYLYNMKYIITEGQSSELFLKLLKTYNIKYDIMYWNDNGLNSITGTVYLYKDGKPFGSERGYEFFYKYDSRFGSLEYEGHYPKLENNSELFVYVPSDMTVGFFSDKVKEYLRNYIDKGYSGLRRK